MFDFILCYRVATLPERVLNNPCLGSPKITQKDGILNYKYLYRGLTIQVQGNSVEVSGSFHKYFSNGQNDTDFTRCQFISVLNELWQLFGFNPHGSEFNTLEMGVNLDYSPEKFIYSIIDYSGEDVIISRNEFLYCRTKDKQPSGSKVDYYIKSYDKHGKLRIEAHINRSSIIKRHGIKTLADLTLPDNFKKLGNMLLEYFDKFLTYDNTLDYVHIPERESEILKNGQSTDYWFNLKSENPENYKKKRARFKELIIRHNQNKIKHEVRKLIESKVSDLCQPFEVLPKIHTCIEEAFPIIHTFQNADNHHSVTQNTTLDDVVKKGKVLKRRVTKHVSPKTPQDNKLNEIAQAPEKSKDQPKNKPTKRKDYNPAANDLWLSLFPNITYPTIVDYNGDTSKEWFIYFRVNDAEGRRIKKVWKKGINHFNTEVERRKAIYSQHSKLLERIRSGWNPLS